MSIRGTSRLGDGPTAADYAAGTIDGPTSISTADYPAGVYLSLADWTRYNQEANAFYAAQQAPLLAAAQAAVAGAAPAASSALALPQSPTGPTPANWIAYAAAAAALIALSWK